MKQISHYANVEAIGKNSLKVKITSYSACHNCDAKHGCGLMECKNKIIEVETAHAEQFVIGEEVLLTMNQNLGYVAVFLGYVLPLIIMLLGLACGYFLTQSEIIGGISGIIILIPYYLGLFLNRKRFATKFRFNVSKIID